MIISPYNLTPYSGFASSGVTPLPETIAFMTRIGVPNDGTIYFPGTQGEITGAQRWSVTDLYVRELQGRGNLNKTINYWDNPQCKVIHLIQGDTADQCSVNLRNVNTYQIVWENTWTFSYTGAQPDGISSYAHFGLAPSDLDPTNVNFGRYNGPAIGTLGVELGVSNAGNGDTWAMMSRYSLGSFYFTVDSYSGPVGDGVGLGGYSVNIKTPGTTEGIRNGLIVGPNVTTPATQTGVFYYGAVNKGGTPAFFDSKELRGGRFMQGLTADEALMLSRIEDQYQTQLGRGIKIAVGQGDSTMFGAGSSGKAFNWYSKMCVAKGWRDINGGQSGAPMQRAVPIDCLGGTNVYDRRTEIPTYSTAYGALLASASINDCGLNLATYTEANFSTQLGEWIDAAIAKGWPPERIVLVIGLYCTNAQWADYLTYGAGVVVPATNVRHLSFIAAAGMVAGNKGVTWVNPYQEMIDNGGTGPDGRHPDDTIYQVIADYVVANITSIT